MDLIQGLMIITPIHLLALATPGPDFVLVSQQTLSKGKKAGLMCSVGIVLGISIHLVYSALGLAVIIANSPTILWVIKISGGGFFIYLGLISFRTNSSEKLKQSPVNTATHSSLKSAGIGFLGNLLNPKAPLYFISLFTVVLSPDMPLRHLALYGAWMIVLELAWFSAVVTVLTLPKVNSKYRDFGPRIDRALGATLIVLGIIVIATGMN